MLIDLTKKPLIVYPEDCPTSVVVRTIGNQDVSGIVMKPGVDKEARRVSVEPGAKIVRGRATLYETRLPLPGTRPKEPITPRLRWREATVRASNGPTADLIVGRVREPSTVSILPEPFEVASSYKDAILDTDGTWRASIRVEYVAKMKKAPWVVTILDGTTNAALSTVAVSGLDPNPNPEFPDVLPLTRAVQRTVAPTNAWTRLLEDDTDVGP